MNHDIVDPKIDHNERRPKRDEQTIALDLI